MINFVSLGKIAPERDLTANANLKESTEYFIYMWRIHFMRDIHGGEIFKGAGLYLSAVSRLYCWDDNRFILHDSSDQLTVANLEHCVEQDSEVQLELIQKGYWDGLAPSPMGSGRKNDCACVAYLLTPCFSVHCYNNKRAKQMFCNIHTAIWKHLWGKISYVYLLIRSIFFPPTQKRWSFKKE